MKKLAILVLCLTAFAANNVTAQGKFSGLVFGDYFYNVARDTAAVRLTHPGIITPGTKDFQGFQIRRIYFTYDYDISEKFTSRFRVEGNTIAAQGGSSSVASRLSGSSLSQLFIKDAWLKWKNVFQGSDLIFGIQPTAAYDISETIWGYRSLEKTIMDLRGIIPSRDMGLSLRGKFDDKGMFAYWLMLAGNSGQDDINNKYKRISLNLQIKPVDKVIVTLFGDFRGLPNVNDPTSVSAPPATVSANVMTYALFAAYNDPEALTVGVEGFLQTQDHAQATSLTDKALKSASQLGFTVFGVYCFDPMWAVILRYDLYNPDTDSNYPFAGSVTAPGYAASLNRNYIIAGLAYKPEKNVQIIPNIQYESYQTPRNVVASPTAAVASIDASVTARLTFYWLFM